MKKVFISQPMRGKTKEKIEKQRNQAIEDITRTFGRDFEIIDSYFSDYDPQNGCIPLKYLAKSIELLADADVAYFCDGWRCARGCEIEHKCAEEYGIGIMYQGDEEDWD